MQMSWTLDGNPWLETYTQCTVTIAKHTRSYQNFLRILFDAIVMPILIVVRETLNSKCNKRFHESEWYLQQ
jgi:hypothetical protein